MVLTRLSDRHLTFRIRSAGHITTGANLLESSLFLSPTSRNRALKILGTVRWWLNQPRLGRERVQALGQMVQLPLFSERGCFRPGWRLVLQGGERRGFVHRRHPAVEAQFVRLLLESTLRERILEGAIS